MLNSTPRSIWLIAFTAVVYLFQLWPVSGVLLLILMAPLWTVATINAGFLGLGFEALAGKIHKAWLIAPLVWFAGYEYIAWASHRSVEPLRNEVRAFNGKKSIAFDPAKQSLVIERSTDSGAVRKLLEHYDIPVVYAADRRSRPLQHIAWRISRSESCEAINDSHRFQTPVRGLPLEIYSGRFPEYLPHSCFFGVPEEPPTPVVVYSVEAEELKKTGYLQYNLVSLKLSDDVGAVTLRSASAMPYSWYPAPTMGCSFNSFNPSWSCKPDFFRDSAVWVLAEPGDTAAKALALKPIAPITTDVIQQRQIRIEQSSLDAFRDFIADTSRPITAADLREVAKHPNQYDTKASQIAVAIGKVLAAPQPRLDVAANLGEMLARMPDAQFKAIVPQLLDSYASAQQINTSVIWDQMANRLSSLGVPALPVLERLASEQPDRLTRPIYALCRVGAAAARDGEQIAKHLRGTQRSDDEHIAAFKTLLRIGRGDLLENESDAQSQYRSDAYKSWRRTITPDSSINVCADDS
jgi:hypothetical protein